MMNNKNSFPLCVPFGYYLTDIRGKQSNAYEAGSLKDDPLYQYITGTTQKPRKSNRNEDDELPDEPIVIEEVEVVVDVDASSDTSRVGIADDSSNHSAATYPAETTPEQHILKEQKVTDLPKLESVPLLSLPSSPSKGQFQCDICNKSFSQFVNLQTHERVHTGERPYRCEICLKSFTQQSNLWKHIRTHTGERPFHCTFCSKAFAQQANLTKHVRVHTGERPYSCKFCTKAFSQRANLHKHERTHTGERPYSCRYCLKAFAQQSNLDKHERVHTGDKPYSCKQCFKSFTQQSNLTKHESVHLKEKPYKCTICQKSYTQKGNLQKHQLTCHEKKVLT